MRIAVINASVGRPIEVASLLDLLAEQFRKPDQVFLSVESYEDLPSLLPPGVCVIRGPRGASSQRNRALDQGVSDYDIIVFWMMTTYQVSTF